VGTRPLLPSRSRAIEGENPQIERLRVPDSRPVMIADSPGDLERGHGALSLEHPMERSGRKRWRPPATTQARKARVERLTETDEH
jgi:hypothetical protein